MSLAPITCERRAALGVGSANGITRATLIFGAAVLGLVPMAVVAMALLAQQGSLDSAQLIECCAAPVVFLAMLLQPCLGVAVFIVATGLSPELPGQVEHVRLSDFVFLLFFIAVLARVGVARLRPSFRNPLTLPTMATVVAGLLSLCWGPAVLGRNVDCFTGLCILLKRCEYLLIFLFTAQVVRSRRWADRLLVIMLVTAAIAVVHGFLDAGQTLQVEKGERVQGIDGNYNILAGYLVPHICLSVALLFSARGIRARLCLLGLLIGSVACLAYSYSREGYLMLLGALLFLGALRYRTLLALIGLVILAAPWMVPSAVVERAADTLEQIQNYQTDRPGGNSLTARVMAWNSAFRENIGPSPLFGVGVGSVRFSVDNEFLLRWSESGLLGLAAFLWMLWGIGAMLRRAYAESQDPRGQAVTCAVLAGFVALLIQATVAVSFTTMWIMEPFFVLLGLAWAYQHVPVEEPATDSAEPVPSTGTGRGQVSA